MRLYAKKIKKVKGRKGKRKKPLILRKKGKLLKAKYDKKTKAVYFRTKGNLSKMYIALVKIQPKKKAKKGNKANTGKVTAVRYFLYTAWNFYVFNCSTISDNYTSG